MKYLHIFACFFYFHATFAFVPYTAASLHVKCFSVNDFIVQGQIRDSLNRQAVEFASVSILNEQKQMVGGSMTDQEGAFRVVVKKKVILF